MSIHDPALIEYASRLLLGTDVTPATAVDVACGREAAPGPVAGALRDGWTAGTAEPSGEPR
ncbi:hypothetical protein [Actinopolymorpha pittospori]|uniref:Uncharacterized protein n=1 Tax=Actinopolymorpha pittospori TaxID=648752 RepID=A0A927N173_9ACTN|nr:hypothetical protein [Actinopolymorpha pittospori]MBE1609892.1 hypothetical protein [Actinopolymorpha pittospori]